jgi:hypothetical protein
MPAQRVPQAVLVATACTREVIIAQRFRCICNGQVVIENDASGFLQASADGLFQVSAILITNFFRRAGVHRGARFQHGLYGPPRCLPVAGEHLAAGIVNLFPEPLIVLDASALRLQTAQRIVRRWLRYRISHSNTPSTGGLAATRLTMTIMSGKP